jgi:hypothetical protein
MTRIILLYGPVAGTVIISCMILSIRYGSGQEWLGFLIMFIAFASIVVAIKQYRDDELGGLISFPQGLRIGLGISAIAGVVYVLVWELYLVATNFEFIDTYVDAMVAERESAGASPEQVAEIVSKGEQFRAQYANPLFRLPVTFLEVFPVGLLVSLVGAALLRTRKPLRHTN